MNSLDNLFDISITLRPNMLTYPNDSTFKKQILASKEQGSKANLSTFTLGSHTGTHIDFPSHFFKNAPTSDNLALTNVIGNAYVVDIDNNVKTIESKHFSDKLLKTNAGRVLFKTFNSHNKLLNKDKFSKDYAYLTLDAAKFLVKQKVKTVGIDYLSIEKYGTENSPVHKHLLKNGVTIIESLNLQSVSEKKYFLICLPLKISATDGSPARAILINNN